MTKMPDIELKPCPFCGGEAVINEIPPHKHTFVNMPDCEGFTYIECTRCGGTVAADTTQQAIEAWNRRADMDWISVKARLPERDGCYLCRYRFSKNNPKCTGLMFYFATDEFPHWQNKGSYKPAVTYWMPLPEPPKGD